MYPSIVHMTRSHSGVSRNIGSNDFAYQYHVCPKMSVVPERSTPKIIYCSYIKEEMQKMENQKIRNMSMGRSFSGFLSNFRSSYSSVTFSSSLFCSFFNPCTSLNIIIFQQTRYRSPNMSLYPFYTSYPLLTANTRE